MELRSLWVAFRRETGQAYRSLALGVIVLLVVLCISVPTATRSTASTTPAACPLLRTVV